MEKGRSLSPEDRDKELRSMAWDNFGFYKVERLPGNIGYLDFRVFMPPEVAGDTAIAAMNFFRNKNKALPNQHKYLLQVLLIHVPIQYQALPQKPDVLIFPKVGEF